MTAGPTWPAGPSGGYRHRDDDYAPGQTLPAKTPSYQEAAHEVIGEMARLLGETRSNMLTSVSMLGAVAIGIAFEAGSWAKALQPSMAGVVKVGLMCGLAFSWLTAITLLALAGRPVLNALSELRWRTGAPLDPRAGWLTLPSLGANREEWTWIRAHLLLGAARLVRYRVQLADTWTCVTAAFFLACTATTILGL